MDAYQTGVESKSHSHSTSLLSVRSPARKYHLHGLADSQTQSQLEQLALEAAGGVGRVDGGGGEIHRLAGQKGRQASSGRVGPSSRDVGADGSQEDGGSPYPPGLFAENTKRSAKVSSSIASPVAGPSRLPKSTAKTNSRNTPPPVINRLQRYDSFAGPLDREDQVNAIIRDSTLFQKPLSKLGFESQEDDEDSLEVPPLRQRRKSRSPSPEVPSSNLHKTSSYFIPDSDNSQHRRSQSQSADDSLLKSPRSQLSHHQEEFSQSPFYPQGQAQDSGSVESSICL